MADRVFVHGDVVADRFELTKPLGKGAFGVVWRGVDLRADGAPVAVKLLFDRYRRDPKMLGRFRQEAKILDTLQHPNIAAPIAWSAEEDDAFLAMEFVDGETLDVRFADNAAEGTFVPAQGIAWIADRLCEAVQFAHAHDVVHRDMKPKNVMVNRRGERPFLKVLDFGIAKMLVGSEIDPTTAGRVLGSVLYISPEQVLSRPIDHRADIFSVGTMMFELVTLRRAWARDEQGAPHPFHIAIAGGEHNSHVAVLKRIARGERPSACAVRPELSPEVDRVLHKAMAVDPDDRYANAVDFSVALRAALIEPNVEDSILTTIIEDDPQPTLTDDVAVSVHEPELMTLRQEFDEIATESSGVEIAAPIRSNELEISALPPALAKRQSSVVWYVSAAVLAVLAVLFFFS